MVAPPSERPDLGAPSERPGLGAPGEGAESSAQDERSGTVALDDCADSAALDDGAGVAAPRRLLSLFYAAIRAPFAESRCQVCTRVLFTRPAGQEPFLCPDCAAALPRMEKAFCPYCGEAALWPDLPLAPCGRCLTSRPPWTVFIFHGLHQGLLRQLVIGLKFGQRLHLGALLGQLLAGHPAFAGLSPDLVLPVPLHKERLAGRGYNQARLLATALARHLRLPLAPELLIRCKNTVPQTGAGRAFRQSNLRGAFLARGRVQGRHILLVDDTMTTGATLSEATRCLLQAGAARVDAAVVSRTARIFRPSTADLFCVKKGPAT